jgi:hypothetical protein
MTLAVLFGVVDDDPPIVVFQRRGLPVARDLGGEAHGRGEGCAGRLSVLAGHAGQRQVGVREGLALDFPDYYGHNSMRSTTASVTW